MTIFVCSFIKEVSSSKPVWLNIAQRLSYMAKHFEVTSVWCLFTTHNVEALHDKVRLDSFGEIERNPFKIAWLCNEMAYPREFLNNSWIFIGKPTAFGYIKEGT